ncbi:MAG: PadR family transcriptional regulator [Actinobacteria bacterium]|nr:PadR family transcriptional regulator [Actinomycetota bacterium]
MLELAVLGLLKEQPLHGYELKKRLGETLGFLWGVSYGSLYPALRRLEREGAIESVEPGPALVSAPVPTGSLTGDLSAARHRTGARRAESSRRTRKAYRITERGDARLVELLLEDDERTDDDKGFAIKLAFCRHAPADARLRFLERRRDTLRTRTEHVRTRRGRERTPRSQDRYLTSLLEHRARATASDLEWVEQLIAEERTVDTTVLGHQEGATA